MKVGLYYKNGYLTHVDAARLEKGNPGMGGRQYMNLMIAKYMQDASAGSITSAVFMEADGRMPAGLDKHVCDDLLEAFSVCKTDGSDYFITDVTLSFDDMQERVALAEKIGLRLIVRLGLIPSSRILSLLASSEAVSAVVCVEQQVMEMLRDHPVITKTTVVSNGISLEPYELPIMPMEQRDPVVTYIGSLVPQKGFGRLARAWPHVIKHVPDAILQVIGSGSLYGSHKRLGAWGVASESFEARHIRPFLSGKDGKPHPSVRFLGVLGEEKVEKFRHSVVGVANPVGYTETFCISAVEIQAAGTPVIAGAKYGLFDTVKNNETGFLISNETQLAEKIIELLEDRSKAAKMACTARDFVNNKYDMRKIGIRWMHLLRDLQEGIPIQQPPEKKEFTTVGVLAAKINGRIARSLNFPCFWPSYIGIVNATETIKRRIFTFLAPLMAS